MAVFDLPEINLPGYARFYNFADTTKKFNSNYDIVWSFQYKIPSTSFDAPNTTSKNYQAGFTTFLTTLTSPTSSLPGQYLGDSDPSVLSGTALHTEGGDVVFTEGSDAILVNSTAVSGQLLKIAFDTTGLYAVSGRSNRPGVSLHNVHREAFIIRDYQDRVLCNVPLSTCGTTFSAISSEEFRTLRFRYVNLGRKLHIDFRDSNTTSYTKLTTFDLGYRVANFDNLDNVFCGFSYCTPISSSRGTNSSAASANAFFLKEFTAEGFIGGTVTTQTITSEALSSNPNNNVTTVTNVSAIPIT
tara:strand:- start:174 stop:1073 length:900 start_codon:yes stop_codon:yes gene_type:complete